MTRKVFWEDPYLSEINAIVTGSNENDITVDQTIFYAFSGGQESDHGSIGCIPVVNARKEGSEIIYTLVQGHNLKVGDPVTIKIDWSRRYKLMRLHFGAEIVLEIAYQKLKGIVKIGAHISEDKARIDFSWHESLSQILQVIEQEAQAIINANYKIQSAFSDREMERRYWKVDGFAQVACGGTHLRQTGEVGVIHLLRKRLGKDKERIEIHLLERQPEPS